MIDGIDFKEEWRKIAYTDDVKVMWMDIHLNGISNYFENVVFKEFRFTKKLRTEIMATIQYKIFDLHRKGEEISFKKIAEQLREVIKTECEEAMIGKKRLQKILSELNQSLGDLDDLDELKLYIKAMILDRQLQFDLFEDGYTIAEIDDITPEISYIMNQLRD